MARIAGVDIPRDKRTVISLSYVKGIGRSTAKKICEACNIDSQTRVKDLVDSDLNAIKSWIADNELVTEGDLKREVTQNIKRSMEIKSYKGSRHSKGLPVRGQRTQTNARTRKGPKKTVAGKKVALK